MPSIDIVVPVGLPNLCLPAKCSRLTFREASDVPSSIASLDSERGGIAVPFRIEALEDERKRFMLGQNLFHSVAEVSGFDCYIYILLNKLQSVPGFDIRGHRTCTTTTTAGRRKKKEEEELS